MTDNGSVAKLAQKYRNVYAEITEQPAPKAIRFRYECEGRLAGSIPGLHSTNDNRTYPSIRIVNYVGEAVVTVSCVTRESPYRPHPHRLVGKDGCNNGVCTLTINNSSMSASFGNLGIQCVRKKEIEAELGRREILRIDPFHTGFDHGKMHPPNIDLSAVRLCFQVFLVIQKKKYIPLKPIVSDPIFDKKGTNDLVITKLSHCSDSVIGGKEIILLCEKIVRDDIKIRFYEKSDNTLIWHDYGIFKQSDVHKQCAISFKTPKYYNQSITKPKSVFIQLVRPSDDMCSEPLPFDYIPRDDLVTQKRKREECGNNPRRYVTQYQQREQKTPRIENPYHMHMNIPNQSNAAEYRLKMERNYQYQLTAQSHQFYRYRETTNNSPMSQFTIGHDEYIDHNVGMNGNFNATAHQIPSQDQLIDFNLPQNMTNSIPSMSNNNQITNNTPWNQCQTYLPNMNQSTNIRNNVKDENNFNQYNISNQIGNQLENVINNQTTVIETFSDNYHSNNLSMLLDTTELKRFLEDQSKCQNIPVLDEESIANSFTKLTTNNFHMNGNQVNNEFQISNG